ncbi:MAG: HAD-IA family hydrolase [Clostridia bacterium]|nr:HAD-IA family hydrolase [Clostridia bacterium]
MKYDLYMFDFDLTIGNSAAVSTMIYERACASLGYEFDKTKIFYHLGIAVETTYEEITGGVAGDDNYKKFLAAFLKAIDDTFTGVELYDDVKSCFERIKADGKKVAIVTSRKMSAMNTAFEKYPDVKELIDVFITTDFTESKPSPDPMFKCLAATNVKAENAVYVGDAKNDYLSATAAGVDFIYINREGNVKEKGAITRLKELI